jgi:ABC-type iron transport system FetAB ATPase subunit
MLPGLNAVTGDEGSGKTRFLRQCCEAHPDSIWLDLRLPGLDDLTPKKFWAQQKTLNPSWSDALCSDLSEALALSDHMDKQLFMLSAGSRRKVALISLLSCGAQVTCLDQPFAALDQASIGVLCDFLNDMSDHPTRSWVVADYVADTRLRWRQVISLDPS